MTTDYTATPVAGGTTPTNPPVALAVALDYSNHWNLTNTLLERIAIALEGIHTETKTIDSHLDILQSCVTDTTSSCSTGPHMRMLGGGCTREYELTRALTMTNLKKTGALEEVRNEINSPTIFP